MGGGRGGSRQVHVQQIGLPIGKGGRNRGEGEREGLREGVFEKKTRSLREKKEAIVSSAPLVKERKEEKAVE